MVRTLTTLGETGDMFGSGRRPEDSVNQFQHGAYAHPLGPSTDAAKAVANERPLLVRDLPMRVRFLPTLTRPPL